MEGGAGFGDDRSGAGKRAAYQRLTSSQTAKLENLETKDKDGGIEETYILECPHPDESQRSQLAADVGIEPKQVKFWFQNKRTQLKNQNERADNAALRAENERIRHENNMMRATLKNVLCPTCAGTGNHDHSHLQQLMLENAQLKEQYDRVTSVLARYLETQDLLPEQLQLAASIPIPGFDLSLGSLLNQGIDEGTPRSTLNHHNFVEGSGDNNNVLNHQEFVAPIADDEDDMEDVGEMETALAMEVAVTAKEELVRLMRMNEPLWINSPALDGKLVLHRESYERIFPRARHFNGPNARLESSKESGIVNMNGALLVQLLLDSSQWVNLFPTIVPTSATIHVLDEGLPETRSGALQLMYEEMHILSPLVPAREFHFLRHCQQLEVGLWIITDVSYDPMRDIPFPLSNCWRHPSGCMIQDLNNGSSMVTWVEHVEVDDRFPTHPLYRDLVSSGIAYGAERWIMELQRMCQRSASYCAQRIPENEVGGVINTIEGRRSVMRLAHRMIKTFCGSLNMTTGRLEFPSGTEENGSGVRVSVQIGTGDTWQPSGTIITAVTSLWVPLPYHQVFDYLIDTKRRLQWDILACTTPVHRIGHISNGAFPGNNISIFQPFVLSENKAFVLQESFLDPVGSYIVFAPLDISATGVVVEGENSSMIPVLPSGFVITGDGRPKNTNNALMGTFGSGAGNVEDPEGSVLTVSFQILVSNAVSPAGTLVNMESVASLNNLLTSTVQKLKDALKFP